MSGACAYRERMELLAVYPVLVACHGLAGGLSLVLALIPMIARKGSAVHRRAGWGFVVAMAFTALTGVIISSLWLIAPLAVKPPAEPLTAGEAALVVSRMRFFALFLCYLALLIAAGVWHGVRMLRARRAGAPAPGERLLDRGLPALLLAGGVALIYAGLTRGSVLPAAFGFIGVMSGYDDLRAIRATPATGSAAVLRHLESMLGAFIAALTAFSVFNARRLPDGWLPDTLQLVPWLAPAVIGLPAIALLKRRYRRGRPAPRPAA